MTPDHCPPGYSQKAEFKVLISNYEAGASNPKIGRIIYSKSGLEILALNEYKQAATTIDLINGSY